MFVTYSRLVSAIKIKRFCHNVGDIGIKLPKNQSKCNVPV